ncbi:hypothetical protein P6P35_16010, partial [Clostridium perfringens]|nr:hypothetical protein [Clostridium perfringens]
HHAARPGAETERLACCKAIAAALEGEAPADVKYWMMKLVAFAGKAEVVPALAKQLTGADKQLREIARYALQQNASAESAAALRQELMNLWADKKEP